MILITGANGEIGKGLIHSLSGKKQKLVALDFKSFKLKSISTIGYREVMIKYLLSCSTTLNSE